VGTERGILEIVIGPMEIYRFYPSVDVYGDFDSTALTAVEASGDYILTNNVKRDP
jgi:hypothetical protein